MFIDGRMRHHVELYQQCQVVTWFGGTAELPDHTNRNTTDIQSTDNGDHIERI